MANGREEGVVKWFNSGRGYGFITRPNGEKDVFVHFSNLEMDGYKALAEGQRVSYEVEKTVKGLAAVCVRVLQEADAESV